MTDRKLVVRSFKNEDLDSMDLLEERGVVLRDRMMLHVLGSSSTEDEFCGTVFCDDEPIFVGGWTRNHRDVVRVFVIPSAKIFDHSLAFTRKVLKWLHKIEAMPGVEKVVTLSRCNGRIDAWMVALGFTYEHTVKKYVDGYDYRLWSRTKEGST